MCGWGVGKLFFFFHFSSDFLFQELNWSCLEPGKLLRHEHQQGPSCGELWGASRRQALLGKTGSEWAPPEEESGMADPGILDLRSQ